MVGEGLIRDLEVKSNQLNEEKRKFEERLQAEADARKKENEKNMVFLHLGFTNLFSFSKRQKSSWKKRGRS